MPTFNMKIGRLSKDVFEGCMSTLFICLDTNKFVLLSFFSLMKRVYLRVSNKPLPNDAKGPLPVDVHRSTTLLLKLPNHYSLPQVCLVPFCALIFAIQGT